MQNHSTVIPLEKDEFVCPVRGVKLLLPAADKLDDFKRFVDFVIECGYNTVMLEVGGAMEFRRHPEINEGWLAYAREMREFPGKTHQIQQGFGWSKNSIHADNGGGGVLGQSIVKSLVEYCRTHGMTVVPEVPSLSHSDYLLTRHPELSERKDDPYPDTYCPSDPRSHALLFDVLDEVIEVFDPETVNIGHDEWYSIGLCDRCRQRPAEDLYADDIRAIHEYLARRHRGTILWGEKLLNAACKDGAPVGGGRIPATYRAIDLIPRDIGILHWYWGINRNYEREYLTRNMPVTYGNFCGSVFPEWSRRIRQPGVQGAIISNWGATDQITLQRNGILFEVVFAAMLFRDAGLHDGAFETLRDRAFHTLYERRRRALAREVGAGRPARIRIVHTTDLQREFKAFDDGYFVRPDDDLLGEYVLRYDNGAAHRIPVLYGHNIGSVAAGWERRVSALYDCYELDHRLLEPSYSTLPCRLADGTWYELEIEDPCPTAKLVDIAFQARPGVPSVVRWRSVVQTQVPCL